MGCLLFENLLVSRWDGWSLRVVFYLNVIVVLEYQGAKGTFKVWTQGVSLIPHIVEAGHLASLGGQDEQIDSLRRQQLHRSM